MQANDVRALRQCAVPTAAVGVVCAVIGILADGAKGGIGALLALAMVTVFFAIDYYVFARVGKDFPMALMPVALGTYLVKIIVLAVLSASFRDTTAFNGRVFGFTAIVCILVWSACQVRVWVKTKAFYVDPVGKL
jgi:ATP synthase protein I